MHPHDQTPRTFRQPPSDWDRCYHCGLVDGKRQSRFGEFCSYCGQWWRSVAQVRRDMRQKGK